MKIILLGDSITEGIGSLKVNFASNLKGAISNSEIINLAKTGTTIDYALEKAEEIKRYRPDIVIVFYGQVDALTRVKSENWTYKFIPKRYKGPGMFDPRALYTRKQPTRLIQKIDSFFRYNLKKILIYLQGYEQWNTIDEFESKYIKLLKEINPHTKRIICLSTVCIDDKYFPYCNREFKKYNEVIKKVAVDEKCTFLDIYSELSKYDFSNLFYSDKYHPNKNGYLLISDNILSSLGMDTQNEKLN